MVGFTSQEIRILQKCLSTYIVLIPLFFVAIFCTVFQSLFPAIISMGGENVWRNLPQICFSTKFPWPIYFIILSHKGLCWPLYVLKGHMQLGSPRKVSWLAECIKYLNQLQIFFLKNSEIHSKYESQDLTWSGPHDLVNNLYL